MFALIIFIHCMISFIYLTFYNYAVESIKIIYEFKKKITKNL